MSQKRLFSVFRNRNFLVFCLSQTVSQFGDKLDHRALIALLAVLAANSPTAYAQLAFFFTLPVILFGPVSGVFVDRWSRKKVMVTCDSFRGVLVFLIPLAVFLMHSLWAVYILVFIIFFFGLFFNTAKMSIIPNMVERDQLLAANSVNTLVGRVATVAAFVLGDLVVSWSGWSRLRMVGWQASFYFDALSFVISAVAISTIYVSFKRSREVASTAPQKEEALSAFRQTLFDVKEGFRLILMDRQVTFVMSSVVVLTMVAGSVYVLAVPIVNADLHRGAFSVGTLGAIMGVGMILGAFLYGTFGHGMRKTTVIIVGFGLIGILMIVFSFLQSFLITGIVIIMSGFVLAPIMITQDTLLHQTVPEEARGRIFGTREWTLNGLFMVSAGLMALAARLSSARATLRGVGVTVVLLSMAGILARRGFVRGKT